jgi:hypothetical protein
MKAMPYVFGSIFSNKIVQNLKYRSIEWTHEILIVTGVDGKRMF